MSLSDKDLETLFFIKLLKTVPSDDDLVAFADGRLSEHRLERVRKRITDRAARIAAPFERNAAKKALGG
jgi:hypothetical protein